MADSDPTPLQAHGAGMWEYSRALAGTHGREALLAAVRAAGADAPLERLQRELRLAVASHLEPQAAGVRARLGGRGACAEIPLVLAGRLSGELSDHDQAMLEEHLAGCDGCTALAARMDAAERLLEKDGPPPAWVEAAVPGRRPAEKANPFAVAARSAAVAGAEAGSPSTGPGAWVPDDLPTDIAPELPPPPPDIAGWTATPAAGAPLVAEAPSRRRRRLRGVPAVIAALLALGVAGGALAAGGVFDSDPADERAETPSPMVEPGDRDSASEKAAAERRRERAAERRREARRERAQRRRRAAERRRRAAAQRRRAAARRRASAAPVTRTVSAPAAGGTAPAASNPAPQARQQPQPQAPRQEQPSAQAPSGGGGEVTRPQGGGDEPGRVAPDPSPAP